MKNKSNIILQLLAGILFIICYFFRGRDVLHLSLGIALIIIAGAYYIKYKNINKT